MTRKKNKDKADSASAEDESAKNTGQMASVLAS